MPLTFPFLLILAALLCFGIPAVKAMLDKGFDYTNSGLFCLTLMLMLGSL